MPGEDERGARGPDGSVRQPQHGGRKEPYRTRGIIGQWSSVFNGTSEDAIETYMRLDLRRKSTNSGSNRRGTYSAIRMAQLVDESGNPTVYYVPGKPLNLEVKVETNGRSGLSLEVFLADSMGLRIGMASLYHFHGQTLPLQRGTYCCVLSIHPMWLASGSYSLDLTTSIINTDWDHYVEAAIRFDVPYSNPLGQPLDFKQAYGFGSLALLCSAPAQFSPISA